MPVNPNPNPIYINDNQQANKPGKKTALPYALNNLASFPLEISVAEIDGAELCVQMNFALIKRNEILKLHIWKQDAIAIA